MTRQGFYEFRDKSSGVFGSSGPIRLKGSRSTQQPPKERAMTNRNAVKHEQVLLFPVLAGDDAGFNQLLAKSRTAILKRMLKACGGDEQLAEEAVQEGSLGVWLAIKDGVEQEMRFSDWVTELALLWLAKTEGGAS
jgi:Sigma-70 region 2